MNTNNQIANVDDKSKRDWLRVGSSYKKPTVLPSTTQTIVQHPTTAFSSSSSSQIEAQKKKSKKEKKERKGDRKDRKSRKHKRYSDDEYDVDDRRRESRRDKHREDKDKKKKRKRHYDDDYDDEDRYESKKKRRKRSHWDELQEVYEFEKKRIRIDPRSNPSMMHTTGKTLWETTPAPSDLSVEPDENVFQYDYVGDPNNLLFGSIYREDVPAYRLYNNKNPYLGDALVWKRALQSSSDDNTTNKSSSHRYWKNRSKQKHIQRIEPIRYQEGEWKHILSSDYIAFDDNQKSDQIDDELEESVAQIGETFEEYIMRRTKEFNEYLNKNQYDVNTWLQFIAFQDELIKLQRRKNPTSIIEKKIAIYEKALSYNPQSAVLLSGHLRESYKLYPAEKVNTGWQKALQRCPFDDALWQEYILFKRSNFADFSVTSMRNVYSSAVGNLLGYKRQISSNDRNRVEELEYRMLVMFYEACMFEQQSGYSEKAIAMCQAMVEINCNCPIIYTTWHQQYNGFKEFWQSEAPRFGEEHAQGWSNWLLASMENETEHENYNDDITYDENLISGEEDEDLLDVVNEKSIFVQWLKEEERRSNSQFLPCRSHQLDVIETCPDRIVLWEDICDLLFPITSPRVQRELIFILLEIAGLSIYYNMRTTHDQLVHESMTNKSDSRHLLSVFAINSDEKFESWKPQVIPKQGAMIELIRNSFKQALALYANDTIMAMSYLEFEAQVNITEVRSIAKALLNEDRNNMLVWNQYALLEIRGNQITTARKVYDMVLAMMDSSTNPGTRYLIHRCYAEMELSQKNIQQALHILCSASEQNYQPYKGEEISNTRILKARRLFETLFDSFKRDQSKILLNLEFVMLYGLFTYLTTGSVASSAQIFEAVLLQSWPVAQQYHHVFSMESRLEVSHKQVHVSLGTVHEQYLWMLYVKLLYVLIPNLVIIDPTKYEIVSRRFIRQVLSNFLDRFPSHPVGLNIFIETEQRAQLSSNMRRFLDHKLTIAPTPITYIFTIYAELLRGGQESNNRIRSLFERALEYQACRSNIMLWRMYMRFEISIDQVEAAKKLFYRAIDKCPHAKVLWLDVIKLFRDHFSIDDLKEMIDLMNEKEVLMRSNLEEFVSNAEIDYLMKNIKTS